MKSKTIELSIKRGDIRTAVGFRWSQFELENANRSSFCELEKT
jgi:hypothetical protein